MVSWDTERKTIDCLTEHPTVSTRPINCLSVPAALRPQGLQWGNSSWLACHPGMARTMALLLQQFWWSPMACVVCSQNKNSQQAASCSLFLFLCTWSHINLDFVTSLPPSEGNTVILTVVDRFSLTSPPCYAHSSLLPRLTTQAGQGKPTA